MQAGGALVNSTTRFVDPVVGGQVGATAVDVKGRVVGVFEAVGMLVVVVLVLVVVVLVVVVVVVVAVFDPLLTAKTMRTITTAPMAR
jgi:hypothetical protein